MSHLSFSTQNLLRLVQSQSCGLSQSGFVQPAARNLKIFCLLSYQIKKSSKSSNTGEEINIIIDYSSRNKTHVQLIFHYIFHNTVRRSSSDFMSFTLHTDSLASFYLVLFVLNQILDQNLLTAQQEWVMRILTRHIYTDVTQPESKKTKKDFVEFMAKSSRQSIQPSYIYQQHYNNQ